MVQPINYILDVKDPIEQAMRGYALGRQDIEQRQVMGIRGQQEERAQQAFAQQQQDRATAQANVAKQKADAEAAQAALAALAGKGLNATSDDFLKAWIANPAIRSDLTALQGILKEPQTKALINASQSLYAASSQGNVDVVTRLLEEQIAVAEAPGGDPTVLPSLKLSLQKLKQNPETALSEIKTTTGITLMGLKGPDYIKTINDSLNLEGVELPADYRNLQLRAKAAGLVEGTAEFEAFMLRGGADVAPVKLGFRSATAEEAAQFGATSGQIDQDTGRFYPITPPSGMTLKTTPDGGVELVQGPGVGEPDTGKKSTDFVYTTDPKTNEVTAQPIAGTPAARETQEARSSLEARINTAENMLSTIESLVGRPAGNGLTAIKEPEALSGIVGFIEGRLPAKTQAQANLMAIYDQVTGRAFLEAFDTLKGGGQITETEGVKATQALARLQRTQDPEAFKESLYEFADVVRQGLIRAQNELVTIPETVPAPSDGVQLEVGAASPAMDFSKMNAQQLSTVRASTLTDPELDAYIARMTELGF